MKLDWLCAEKATAVSLGCAGLMLADGGLIAGGAIAGAGLLGLWNNARRADGVNSKKVLAEARAALLADYASWAEGRDLLEADLIAADEAMERHLLDCVPPVAELARTTFHTDEFPTHAALLVADRLADKNPIFSETHSSRSPVAREFALLVMKSALNKAKEQPPFLQRLTQEIVLLLPQYLVRIESAVKAADEGSQQRDAATKAMLQQIIASLQQSAAAQGVSADKLRMLAMRIVAKVEDEGEAERALSAAIDELLKLRAEAERGTNFGDEVDEAIRRIFAKVEANDLDGAGRQGAEEYRRLAEQMGELQAAQASLAETNLSVARMAFNPEAMAHWAVQQRKLAEGVAVLSLDQLRHERDEWYETALRHGQRLEMEVAIHLAQRSVAEAATAPERAMCENDLGNALKAQGERSGGAAGLALLARAVSAYEAALEVRTRAEIPANWAMTQNNLGNALQVQGQRSGGAAGLALLARAVSAYEAALEVYTRAEIPANWAMTQENIAGARAARGDLSAGAAQLTHWHSAEAAVLRALEVYDPVNMPYDHGTATTLLADIRGKIAGLG